MTHIAFDLGLKTTGVAWHGDSDHFTSPAHLHRSPMTPAIEHERFAWWRSTFAMILLPHRGADVVVEGPFLHSKNVKGSIGLIMLHGILRAVAIEGGHQVYVVDNQQLKRWATGSGAATKIGMGVAARMLGMDVADSDDNERDAWLLYRMWDERAATAPLTPSREGT